MTQMRTAFGVSGMHCASCGLLVDETLADLAGVLSSTTDVASGRTVVHFDSGVLAIADLAAAIAEIGYKASPT